jgi:hypothetical protein
MKKTYMSNKVRNKQRKPSPAATTQEIQLPDLSKSFENGSFQAVYQKIAREMRKNIIPTKRR